jgi:hypothetical protein
MIGGRIERWCSLVKEGGEERDGANAAEEVMG